MTNQLFQYPPATKFGRVLPKNKIYEHAKPGSAVRELFVSQVNQIVWQYKLAPETINLPAKPDVPEIQIFEITLKTPELNETVLSCIDKAIPLPIIYYLRYEQHIQVMAAYKRPSEADANKWVVSDYFASSWQPVETPRIPLPVVLDMEKLYEQLLYRLIPLPVRANETLAALVSRVEQVRSKQREIEKFTSHLTKEKQFNRKVDVNAQLRQLKSELEQLNR